MSDRTTIIINVPCEIVDEILTGNSIYLHGDGTVRWVKGGHQVAETDDWVYVDH